MSYIINENNISEIKDIIEKEHLYRDIYRITCRSQPSQQLLLSAVEFPIVLDGEQITHFGNLLVFYINKYFNFMPGNIKYIYNDNIYTLHYGYNPLYISKENRLLLNNLNLSEVTDYCVIGDSVSALLSLRTENQIAASQFKIHHGVILMSLDNGILTEDLYHYRQNILLRAQRMESEYYFYPNKILQASDFDSKSDKMELLSKNFGLDFNKYPFVATIKVDNEFGHVWIEESIQRLLLNDYPVWRLIGWWHDSTIPENLVERAKQCYRDYISTDDRVINKIKLASGILEIPVSNRKYIELFVRKFNLYFDGVPTSEVPFYAKTKSNYIS